MLINVITAICMATIVLAPIVVIIWGGRRFDWRVRWIGVGALTFIGSQVIHLPLNAVLANFDIIGQTAPLSAQEAITLGLTAGLCEELMRAAVLTWWVTEIRDHNKASAYGLGHGGIEAVIIGVLGVFTLINMIALQTMDLNALGLTPELLDQVKAQVAAYNSQPWWQPSIAVFERVMAMVNHLFMTVLVLTGLMRRQWGWIAAAVIWHTMINAVAVWLNQHHGVIAAEGALAVMTAGAAYGWWRARTGVLSGTPS